MSHEPAGVYVTDTDDALIDQLVMETAPGPPVADVGAGFPDYISCHPDPVRLPILVIDTGITDVGEGLHNNLPSITGIRQGFLIPSHSGRENNFTYGSAHRSEGSPHIHFPILKDEQGSIGETAIGGDGVGVFQVHRTPLITADIRTHINDPHGLCRQTQPKNGWSNLPG